MLSAVFLVCKPRAGRLSIGLIFLCQPVVILGAFDLLKDDPVVEFEPHEGFGDDPQQPLVIIIRQVSGGLVELVVFLPVISGQNNLVGWAVLSGGLFALAMPRGSGKSTLAETAAIWSMEVISKVFN